VRGRPRCGGTPVPLHVIEGVGYGAALHGWRLEYEDALPPCEWALAKARERGSNFHIVCLLLIRGLGLGNFGRLSDSLADLREGMRLSEINHERYWLPRLPNTLAWLHSEMFDVEEALRLNREGSVIAREMNFPEGDVNSQINLALNYLCLNEPNSAREHLAAAETLLAQDEWFRWVYTIRFQAAYAEYWLMKGDPAEAARYATASLNLAGVTRRRKHIAWASKLLGDLAAMEGRPSSFQFQRPAAQLVQRVRVERCMAWREPTSRTRRLARRPAPRFTTNVSVRRRSSSTMRTTLLSAVWCFPGTMKDVC